VGFARYNQKSRNFVSPLFCKATQNNGNLTLPKTHQELHQELFSSLLADIKEGKKKVLDEIAV
jgi:hypothetical protein